MDIADTRAADSRPYEFYRKWFESRCIREFIPGEYNPAFSVGAFAEELPLRVTRRVQFPDAALAAGVYGKQQHLIPAENIGTAEAVRVFDDALLEAITLPIFRAIPLSGEITGINGSLL